MTTNQFEQSSVLQTYRSIETETTNGSWSVWTTS
jgi:hypothetical protein